MVTVYLLQPSQQLSEEPLKAGARLELEGRAVGGGVQAKEFPLIKGKYAYLMRLKQTHLHLLWERLHNVCAALIISSRTRAEQQGNNERVRGNLSNIRTHALALVAIIIIIIFFNKGFLKDTGCTNSSVQISENAFKLLHKPLLFEVFRMWVTYWTSKLRVCGENKGAFDAGINNMTTAKTDDSPLRRTETHRSGISQLISCQVLLERQN